MRERANTGNSWKTGLTLSALLCTEIRGGVYQNASRDVVGSHCNGTLLNGVRMSHGVAQVAVHVHNSAVFIV
jgi:hypothetical protein